MLGRLKSGEVLCRPARKHVLLAKSGQQLLSRRGQRIAGVSGAGVSLQVPSGERFRRAVADWKSLSDGEKKTFNDRAASQAASSS